jgi:hypothetical protein
MAVSRSLRGVVEDKLYPGEYRVTQSEDTFTEAQALSLLAHSNPAINQWQRPISR